MLLLLTDAAPYMIKAGDGLSVSYPKTIRVLYPNVDKLIANAKKVFVKSPSRVKIFKTRAPNTPLPPSPVITHWGTWVDAVKYYATNF